MADIIQLRRDTAANWTTTDPILAQGELGIELDTDKFKVGDGATSWSSLNYLIDVGEYIKANTINTFTAPQRGTVTVDNDGSFDLAVTNKFSCTPTATFALTFTNMANGQGGTIKLDNTSGQIITAHANTKVDANFLTTISTAGIYYIGYESTDTEVYVWNTGALS